MEFWERIIKQQIKRYEETGKLPQGNSKRGWITASPSLESDHLHPDALVERDLAEAQEAKDVVARLLPRLSSRRREIVDLLYLGHTQREIAALTGLSQATVNEHVQKIRIIIEDIMDDSRSK